MGLNVVRREEYFKGKYGKKFPFQEFLTDYKKEYYKYVNENGIDAKPGLYQLLETFKQLDIPMVVASEVVGVNPKDAITLEDSFNGIKAAYAAGMMPVMVPDLIKDTSEVDDLLFAKKNDLNEVAEWIRSNRLELGNR